MKSSLLGGLGPGAKDKLRFFIMSMFRHFWGPVTLGGGKEITPFTVPTPPPPPPPFLVALH